MEFDVEKRESRERTFKDMRNSPSLLLKNPKTTTALDATVKTLQEGLKLSETKGSRQ